jgi:GH15 family glucan-1,4-alpha-glucosidase
VPLNIEDYALIGDTHTCALVGRDGSIDWLCLPRFDSPACFAALLGDERHGRWQLGPVAPPRAVRRRYRGDTLVLESDFETDTGLARVVDAMCSRSGEHLLLRMVEGVRGQVRMRSELRLRFDYGHVVPWVRRQDGRTVAVGGPDGVAIQSEVPMVGRDLATWADFDLHAGQSVAFSLTWFPSHLALPSPVDARALLTATEAWWANWMSACTYSGEWQDAVRRSLVTLKALTFAPTGGIVAAATTSLPEQLGGPRNWDYRFCWLRDATITLTALIEAGFHEEALAWREWLLRAVAGDPANTQIMYGVAGERRLTEFEVPWLPGYQKAAPVRVGNAAVSQFQLDVFGEVMDALHAARDAGMLAADEAWPLQRKLIGFVEGIWRKPDEGIWEVRGPRRHFVYSKVMAWVALDRAIRGVEQDGLPGPTRRWRAVRDEIRRQVLEQGYDASRNTFTQYYGSKSLDASLLLLPLVGFLSPADERVRGTVEAIERELSEDGLILRYSTAADGNVDGLPGAEGAFIACTFWLADCKTLDGRVREGRALFERLLSLRNDVGLLAEEWDPGARRMTGNFPQAFSHVPLVNSARYLSQVRAGVREGAHAARHPLRRQPLPHPSGR